MKHQTSGRLDAFRTVYIIGSSSSTLSLEVPLLEVPALLLDPEPEADAMELKSTVVSPAFTAFVTRAEAARDGT
jgi:hypothetical protein